jgi:hypothetical protein
MNRKNYLGDIIYFVVVMLGLITLLGYSAMLIYKIIRFIN